MRKKPDLLLFLAILVISGVIISNFVVIQPNHSSKRLALIKKTLVPLQMDKLDTKPFSLRDIARIDPSKPQIH